ncbi:MAG: Type 1 glutamine amidotransferase-like domain-containing protein [Flavobacteriales bacterium]|nr:Type 1 glutamine amidotransferase-like domain-containing protein [Flavobacteriales bacterium]
MKTLFLCLLALAQFTAFNTLKAQSYTSWFTGDEADTTTVTQPGIVLMGGAGEHDNAMRWFLERANGGDVVVIRASGSDGYNDYLFSDLGVEVNSVQTILFNTPSASINPYVIEQLFNAEAIWIAGGDQYDYISYWQGTAVEDAINNLINVKGGPVGGISAGMAVLCGNYFSAQNGSAQSDVVLNNPFHSTIQLGDNDFLEVPYLSNVVTDTHYDDPDRRGRHATFLARKYVDTGNPTFGIACDEYAAVSIDENGQARVWGDAPNYDDYVYFIRPNCDVGLPEFCEEGEALTWNYNGLALAVLRFNSIDDGSDWFDLNNWVDHQGGEWLAWSVIAGNLQEVPTVAPDCSVGIERTIAKELHVYPNPSAGFVHVDGVFGPMELSVYSNDGRKVKTFNLTENQNRIDLSELTEGTYIIKWDGGSEVIQRIGK